VTYQEKLKDPRWQKKRLKILERDSWCCQICHDGNSSLNIHHLQYQKGLDPWEYEDDKLLTICEAHHEFITVHKIPECLIKLWIVSKSKLDSSRLSELFEDYIEGVCANIKGAKEHG
jgi:5-methylcytosine-specific restriction endonuclease McrA